VNTVVFLGPSLPLDEARSILPEATFLPPAHHADVLSAVAIHHPTAIGLIDGEFGQSMSVWHKEILYAIEQGVHVLGAASMGALRAAELIGSGMQGVGEVYRQFCSGELADDDEVAVLHSGSEMGFRPLSEPMVNVRATIARAHSAGALSANEAARLVDTAKQLHYSERSLATICARADVDATGRLQQYAVNLKGADARLLLETIARLPSEVAPRSVLVRSAAFERMYHNDRRVRHANEEVSLQTVARHAALHSPDFDDVNFAALNRALVVEWAAQLGVQPTEHEIKAEHQRFLGEQQLTEPSLGQWLTANDLSAPEFRVLISERATCRRMQRWLMASRRGIEHTRWLLDEFRFRGEYEALAVSAGQACATLEDHAGENQGLGELTDADITELIAGHQREVNWGPHVPLAEWAEESGFGNLKDLAYALHRAQRVRNARRSHDQETRSQ
jgi:hypothetical protein